jgi:hypothetical protein
MVDRVAKSNRPTMTTVRGGATPVPKFASSPRFTARLRTSGGRGGGLTPAQERLWSNVRTKTPGGESVFGGQMGGGNTEKGGKMRDWEGLRNRVVASPATTPSGERGTT